VVVGGLFFGFLLCQKGLCQEDAPSLSMLGSLLQLGANFLKKVLDTPPPLRPIVVRA
jgi:hypothetical protein